MGKSKIPAPREKDIQRSILLYLNGPARCFAWRVNSGAARLPKAAGGTQLVRFNLAPGHSDVAGLLPGGRGLYVEVKRPGNSATELQLSFLGRVARQGGLAFVAESVEDVRRELLANGYEAP